MSNRKVKMSDISDFVTASDSELSDDNNEPDDDNDNEIEVPQNVLIRIHQNYQVSSIIIKYHYHSSSIISDRTCFNVSKSNQLFNLL